MAEIANIMSKAKQTDRLEELLKPDLVIDLDKRVTNPFDLLQLQGQLDQIFRRVYNRINRRSGHQRQSGDLHKIIGMAKQKAIGFLVGQVMKATRGKANPQMVNQLLRQKLEG